MFSKKMTGIALAVGLVMTASAGLAWQLGGSDWATSVIQFISPSGTESNGAEKEMVKAQRMLISPMDPLPTKNQIRYLLATSKNKRVLYNQLADDANGLHGSPSANPMDNLHPCQMYVMAMNIFMDQPTGYEYQMPGKWFNKQCDNNPVYKKSLDAFKSCLSMHYELQANLGDSQFNTYLQNRFDTYCKFEGDKVLDADLSSFDQSKVAFCSDVDSKTAAGQTTLTDVKSYYDKDCRK